MPVHPSGYFQYFCSHLSSGFCTTFSLAAVEQKHGDAHHRAKQSLTPAYGISTIASHFVTVRKPERALREARKLHTETSRVLIHQPFVYSKKKKKSLKDPHLRFPPEEPISTNQGRKACRVRWGSWRGLTGREAAAFEVTWDSLIDGERRLVC